jgi:hypothetical protein
MIYYSLAAFAFVMSAAFLRRTPDKYQDFCIGASIPIFVILLLPVGSATGWLRPVTIDAQLRAIDLKLGLDGLALTRWLLPTPMYRVISVVYASLPLAMAIAWVVERSRLLLRSVFIGAVLAVPFYLLFPAAGPQYAFKGFPDAGAYPVAVAIGHPRNCIPSMHFTWALLMAINLENSFWKAVFTLYALLMGVATVAGGEHYFVDVIVAVPFALMVQSLAMAWAPRKSPDQRFLSPAGAPVLPSKG